MREYTAVMNNATVTSTNTLVAITAATGAPTIEILRAWCSQRANATSAQQGVALSFLTASSAAQQPVGTATNPSKTKVLDPSSYFYGSSVAGPTSGTGTTGAITTNCTSDGTATKTNVYPDNFNVLNGWLWVPTPPETQMLVGITNTQCFSLNFPVTPGTLTNWTAGLSYRELG
jgi:hypothetical protein